MYNLKTKLLLNKRIARKFALIFIVIGILGIVFLNTIIKKILKYNDYAQQGPLTFGILYILLIGIILYFIINYIQKNFQDIAEEYNNLKKDEDKLVPYEFALDNSADAVYLFTLEGKFLYVNDVTCKMLGYSKEEFHNMYLEQVDLNLDRQSAINIMQEINTTKNWHLETTQRKKDGTIFPVEITGRGFSHHGKAYICTFGRDITQRMKYREKMASMNENLQKSVKEKEVLIKEIHHRVKNNMEIISSLLSMQARRTNNKNMKYILKQSVSRIQTMALVHEFLYLGQSLAKIDFYAYILRLINDIKELYITQNTKLKIDFSVDKLVLSTDRCIQLGMVLHEVCVNSMKYAFKEDRDNLLCIHIKLNDNLVTIKIRDNGEGVKDIRAFHKSGSIGMQLIHTIVENQLNGTVSFVNNGGLECNIEFLKEVNHYE